MFKNNLRFLCKILAGDAYEAEVKDSQIWLKNNSESTSSDILEHWRQSYPARKDKGAEMTIEKYLEDWPVLKTQLAPQLVRFANNLQKVSHIKKQINHIVNKYQ